MGWYCQILSKMKTYLLKILTIALCLGSLNTADAQSNSPAKIKGVLQDAQSKPVDYASVSLLNAKDSTIVTGTLSTETGEYHFDNIKNGTYIVKATEVGFENALSQPFTISDSSKNILVPILKIKSGTHNLNTVVITSTKPTIEHLADKTVINVAGSVLATGNTAMDILERAPGVTVDKDDNISLKGKQGVTVMINDKLTYLSAAQLAILLRSTDGGTIQSIELITNPSAKYDAAGNSGIINIKMKKNKMVGTNGTVSVTGGLGTYAKSSEEFSINHKDGNLNVFGNFSRGDIPQARVININRVVVDTTGKSTYFKQSSFMPSMNHYNNYTFGADYDSSPKNTFGFAVNGYFNTYDQGNTNNTKIASTPTGTPDSTQQTLSQVNNSYKNYTIDLNDTYKIDTLGQELAFDVDYSKFTNNSNANYNTFFSNPLNPTELPLYLRQITPSTIDIRVAKIDYTKNLSKSLKLEAGGKYSDVKTDNDLNATTKDSTGVYLPDAKLTNHFIYDEKISAGYINLTKTYKNTSVEVGVRGENTQSTGDLKTENIINKRNYFNLFPSAFLHHTINDKNELNFSYSRRIDRPDYSDLNPFVYYLDQYTYSEGNPFLKPQYTNNFELDYTYNKSYNLSLSYSRTTDVMQQLILTNDTSKASFQETLNLKSEDVYNASISIPVTVTKWWSIQFDATAFYLKFKSDTLAGSTLNRGKVAYVAKANQTFAFAGFKAELFANYRSSLTDGIYDIQPRYNIDAGISRSFDDKKFNIKFSVSDIFNTERNNLDINYGSDNLQIRQKQESRIARLSLTYNFGNSSIKKREHKTAIDDESQRAGGH